VVLWPLVFRRNSPYGHQDSLVQCLVQFIRMWHQGPGQNVLSMIVMTCCCFIILDSVTEYSVYLPNESSEEFLVKVKGMVYILLVELV